MHSSVLVSVVITTYNRSDALLAVLAGLACQTDPRFEVVVADDGSREEHRAAIVECALALDLKLTHVWHPDIGFTAAKVRNRGVEMTTSEYIIFLDGDCVPEVDFIARHKKLAETRYFVNGSRVLLSPELTAFVVSGVQKIIGRGVAFWVSQRLSGHANKLSHLFRLPGWFCRVQRRFSWKGIRSCNMAVWRSDFERIDGFDESFVGWGHEDADFVLRLHNSGVSRKNGFCATEVFHLWHREAARDQESQNACIVRERENLGTVCAASGYGQVRKNDTVIVTRLG